MRPVSQLQALVDAKTVTIGTAAGSESRGTPHQPPPPLPPPAHLMDIVPPGTLDPTPTLYNTALYSMSGLLAVAFVCNSLIRPVDPKFHLK